MIEEVRTLKKLDFDKKERRKIIENILEEEEDFEINNHYRFILDSAIDKIQQEELKSDPYILGCFNNGFLADILGLDLEIIKLIQKAEAYEALGKIVINLDKIEELQESYARIDGYGSHFAHHDGYTNDISLFDKHYYYFRL